MNIAPQVLIPFDRREALTLEQAAEIATVSASTVARWCAQFNIGRKIGKQWRVSRVALQMYLDDNGPALMAYLDGKRDEKRVAIYFARMEIGKLQPSESSLPALAALPALPARDGGEIVNTGCVATVAA